MGMSWKCEPWEQVVSYPHGVWHWHRPVGPLSLTMQLFPVLLNPWQQSKGVMDGKVFPGPHGTRGKSWLESEGWGWEGSGRRSCRYACEKEKKTSPAAPRRAWDATSGKRLFS